MTILSKQQILSANDRQTKIISMPEWGGDVKIQVMSAGEQADFLCQVGTEKVDNEMAYNLIITSCIDDNGNKIFEQSDKALLASKSHTSILKLFNAILELNHQKEGDVEALAKNS